MKKLLVLLILCLLTVLAAACAEAPDALPAPQPADATPAENEESIQPAADTEQAADLAEELPKGDGNTLVIGDKMFIAQCNDIYLNPDEYLDKTIIVEGVYSEYADTNSGLTYRYVNRLGPGCCGDDGVVGFEVLYDGEIVPAANDWVKAVGQLEKIEENGMKYLALRLSQLEVMEERGMERVTN